MDDFLTSKILPRLGKKKSIRGLINIVFGRFFSRKSVNKQKSLQKVEK